MSERRKFSDTWRERRYVRQALRSTPEISVVATSLEGIDAPEADDITHFFDTVRRVVNPVKNKSGNVKFPNPDGRSGESMFSYGIDPESGVVYAVYRSTTYWSSSPDGTITSIVENIHRAQIQNGTAAFVTVTYAIDYETFKSYKSGQNNGDQEADKPELYLNKPVIKNVSRSETNQLVISASQFLDLIK